MHQHTISASSPFFAITHQTSKANSREPRILRHTLNGFTHSPDVCVMAPVRAEGQLGDRFIFMASGSPCNKGHGALLKNVPWSGDDGTGTMGSLVLPRRTLRDDGFQRT